MGMSSSALAQPGQPAIAAGSNHADFMGRQGGLAANDFAKTVQQGGPAVLQSPSDGQLLIVPKDRAKALDQAKLQNAMVQAQMSGQSVDNAIASALQEQSYGVYKRP